jgi:APA family basic amino acid/polyamine antiporter
MKLKRSIGLLEAIFYGVGIIVGAGVYALIGPAAGMAGNSLWLSFIIGAVIASFTGLSYAELATMFPKAAAEYIYVRRAFGSRFFAFLIGWLLVFTGMISASAVALAFGGYFRSLFNISIVPVSVLLIAFLSLINYKGIKESTRFNIIFTSIEIIGLLIIIFLGVGSFGKVNYFEFPFGTKGVFSAAALIFFAYIGFEDIANISEETKNPRKIIPIALLLSVLITALLYCFTAVSAVSIVNWKDLSLSSAPLSLVASQVLGNKAFLLLSVIALFATGSTVLIILIVTSRMVYGMSKEKSLPEFLALVHERTRTPWLAVLFVMFFSAIFVFLNDLTTVAEITSLAAFITFTVVNLSLIWMRYTMPKMKRAFRVPLNIGNYPVTAFLGVLFSLFMIFQFDISLIKFGIGVLISGIAAYLIFMTKVSE